MPHSSSASYPSSNPPRRSFFTLLPKIDLHCHLDGSIRMETLIELANTYHIQLPSNTLDGLKQYLHVGQRCKNLEDYLRAFEITTSVMQSEEALERIAYELVEDAAAENVWHLEVRYAPILHTRKGLSMARIVEAVLAGLERGRQKYAITTGVIVCGIRNMDPQTSFRLAELAVAYKHRGVVAFDLAGGENGNPAKDHAASFALVLDNNMNTTVHAGEAYGPSSIKQALHYCGAHRIGHGTRLAEDGDLLSYVIDHRIPLEVCLSSNLQTSVVDKIAQHPLRLYFDLGVRVSLNTDNRLITSTTMTDELWLAHTQLGFTYEEIAMLVVQGFKSAFLPYGIKKRLLQRVNQTIEQCLGKSFKEQDPLDDDEQKKSEAQNNDTWHAQHLDDTDRV